MSRQAVALSAVAALLVLVLAWMLVFSPQNDKVTQLRAETQAQVDQQAILRTQLAALEAVRASAPETEAEIARLEAIVPADAALPSALRQLQAAADDAGITFTTLTPVRPELVETDPPTPGLHVIVVGMTFEGSYFQTVDFLRRIEDPSITSRGFLVDVVDIDIAEYPTLSVGITARMFSVLDEVPVPLSEQEPAPAPAPEATPGPEEDA